MSSKNLKTTNKEIAIKALREVSNPIKIAQNKKGELVISSWYHPMSDAARKKLLKCPAIADIYHRIDNYTIKTYITLKK